MKIVFDIPHTTDKDKLISVLQDLARVVAIQRVHFDAWGEYSAVYKLLAAGFPPDKLVEERRPVIEKSSSGMPIWPRVQQG